MNNHYQFTVIIGNVDESTSGLEDSLYEAGCGDALINFKNGTVYLDFDRAGSCLEETVISAINDIESSSIQTTVLSVAPEHLVGLSDIGERLSLTRQAVSLYMLGERGPGNFPRPVLKITNKSALWKWRDVIEWFYEQGKIANHELIEDAQAVEDINAALELRNPKIYHHRQQILQQLTRQAI